MKKGLFLDRDGTLIHNIPYLNDPEQVRLIAGTIEAVKQALLMGYHLFLFSNQSGVGRGYCTLESVKAVNTRMLTLIGLGGIFAEICLATEKPEDPIVYRKPSPRFILEMIETYELDVTHTYMVGDRLSDIEAGKGGGVQPVFVEDYSVADAAERVSIQKLAGVFVYPDLQAFINDID
jgi:D-glycero-D-manno-heptose 1,7-bisphosphate phosphatase